MIIFQNRHDAIAPLSCADMIYCRLLKERVAAMYAIDNIIGQIMKNRRLRLIEANNGEYLSITTQFYVISPFNRKTCAL